MHPTIPPPSVPPQPIPSGAARIRKIGALLGSDQAGEAAAAAHALHRSAGGLARAAEHQQELEACLGFATDALARWRARSRSCAATTPGCAPDGCGPCRFNGRSMGLRGILPRPTRPSP